MIALQQLSWLSLSTLIVADEDLQPIAQLPRLKYLLLSNRFKMEEIARLSGLLPTVHCEWFKPVSEPLNWDICRRCEQHRLVLLTGKGKPLLCLDCDQTQVVAHVAQFKQIATDARA